MVEKHTIIGVVLLSLILIGSSSVLATSFGVSVNTINNIVLPNGTGVFNITVSNYGDVQLRMQIFTVDPQWSSKISPGILEVSPDSSASAILELRPHKDISFGTKGMQLFARDLSSGVVYKQGIIISLKNPNSDDGQYVPSVKLSVDSSLLIDPRNPLPIAVNLQNRNKLDMKNLTIKLFIKDLFFKEEVVHLIPDSELTKNFLFKLNPLTKAGPQNLVVELFYHNKSVNILTKELNIKEIKDVQETTDYDGFLFKEVTSLTLKNNGNEVTDYDAKLKTNFFERLFTSKSPNAEIVNTDDGTFYQWIVNLKPGESTTIIKTENYRYLILIIFLVLLTIILYYVYRSSVLGLKEIVALHNNEGGSSAMKIRIFVKNRSSKTLDGVTVIDTIPRIAEYEKKHYLGSMSPTKVVSSGNKNLLKWELDVLEPFEERILVYNIKSKLRIIGKISLPNAKIKYLLSSGKEKTVLTTNTTIIE